MNLIEQQIWRSYEKLRCEPGHTILSLDKRHAFARDLVGLGHVKHGRHCVIVSVDPRIAEQTELIKVQLPYKNICTISAEKIIYLSFKKILGTTVSSGLTFRLGQADEPVPRALAIIQSFFLFL